MSNVSIDGLAAEINRCLEEYTDEVVDALEETKENLAKEAVKTLKQTSPKREGEYSKSWGKTKKGKKVIVHNKKHYQRTHLLEKGHAKRGGGRVAAIPHIAPVEKEIHDKAVSEFKKVLGK